MQRSKTGVGALVTHHPAWMSHHTGGSRQGHPRHTSAQQWEDRGLSDQEISQSAAHRHEIQSCLTEKLKYKNRKTPRSREHGDCVRDLQTHTPRTCMLTSVAAVLHKTHRKRGVNKEMKGWEMGSRPELLPLVVDDVEQNSDEGCSLGPLEVAASFHSEAMHRVSVSSSCSSPKKEAVKSERV